MANKSSFQSFIGKHLPVADAINEAGERAHVMAAKHQLATVLKLTSQVSPEFITRTALYARQTGYMKDMPALLCAVLSVKSPGLLAEE